MTAQSSYMRSCLVEPRLGLHMMPKPNTVDLLDAVFMIVFNRWSLTQLLTAIVIYTESVDHRRTAKRSVSQNL